VIAECLQPSRRDAADDLVRRHAAAFDARNWDALRSTYHAAAVSISVASAGDPLSVSELVDLLARTASDLVYRAVYSRVEPLGDRALVISGRVRHSIPAGGFADSGYHWLWTLRDERIYRSVVYTTPDAAREAYAAGGVDLGIADR
jgi:ketosteroid isomerase-like protein